MLSPGDPAPDFDLPRPTADGSETYRLSAAAREGPVVVAFYPVADVEGASELLDRLAGVDWTAVVDRLAVLGVSVGEPAAHERVTAAVDVPFPLLLDRDGYFAEGFGVLEPAGDDAVRVRPSVFVVDRRCFVREAWTLDDRDGSLPLEAVRSAVAAVDRDDG